LLSATTVGDVLVEPALASGLEVRASETGDEVIYQEKTQYDNFFKQNAVVFDFAVDPDAIGGRIGLATLSDLDSTSESVAYNIEGIVTGELWTGTDDGIRPFTATINITDIDIASHVLDGETSHLTTTPSGDSFESGDFAANIHVENNLVSTVDLYTTPILDYGSFAYKSEFSGISDFVGDVDSYRLDLEAGSLFTAFVGFRPGFQEFTIALQNEDGEIIASSGTLTPSINALAISESGSYTLLITADFLDDNDPARHYVDILTRAFLEDEMVSGVVNNTLGDAEDLDPLFYAVDGGIKQAAIFGLGPIDGNSPTESDMYHVSLTAGQALSVMYTGDGEIELLDGTGQLITNGVEPERRSTARLVNIISPDNGSYYIRVHSTTYSYELVLARGGLVDPWINPEAPSDLTPYGLAIGSLHNTIDIDTFNFRVNAADELTVFTTTPDIEPSAPHDAPDTYLELYGPDGLLQAESGAGGEGLNAMISHTASQAGIYTLRVYSDNDTIGGYVLFVDGNTGEAPPLQVFASNLSDGDLISYSPETITLDFSAPIMLNSVTPLGLTVNGITADSVTIVDSDTITFNLPSGLADGSYDIQLAAGTLWSLDNQPNEAYAFQVAVDTTAPRIVSSSIQQGDILTLGPHTLILRFDEPLDDQLLLDKKGVFGGTLSGGTLSIDELAYDPDTYVFFVNFNVLEEGQYKITTDSYIRDLAGNLLDGEAPPGTLPPEVSGDGLPGGQFVLMFDVDRSNVETVSDFNSAVSIRTLGSSTGPIKGYINNADDTDPYRLDLQAGQMVTVVLEPIIQDSPLLTLEAMGEQLVVGGPGEAIVWTYRTAGSDSVVDLVVGADMATQFEMTVYLNAVRESDLPAADSSAEPVYDLAGTWVDIPGQPASVATVYGRWQSSVIRQTIDGNILAPGPYTFEFPDMFMPTGDGTLTITARADLDLSSEYLTIDGEGFGFGDVFASASHAYYRTTSINIPMSDLLAMAADGTITFDVTPSPGVNEIRSSGYLTLSIAYPGMRDPAQDAYAVELAAGQLFNAMLYSTDDAYTMELVDTQTGAVVAVGEPGDLSNIQAIGYKAAQAGRYDVRVHTASGSDYTLAVIRDAGLDVHPNFVGETDAPAQSLDNTDRVLGYVQSPRPDRLFALGRPSPSIIAQTVYELDPLTLEPIHTFSLETGIHAYDLAYDGINLYARSLQNGPVWTFDPESGVLLHKIDYVNFSLFSDLASYGGLLVQQTGSAANQLTFYEPFDAEVIRQLDLAGVPQVQFDGLVGAEPRDSLFVTYREYVPKTGYLTWVVEIDAESGQALNSFTIDQANVTSLAFLADQLYAYSSQGGQLGIYDPSTGQPASSPLSTGLYVAIAGDGVVPRLTPDRYTLDLQAGQRVTLSTTTPFDTLSKAGANGLDPALRVIDPNGVEVAADSNGATDGKNTQLSFTATAAGVYTVQVLAETGYGEYVLNVERAPFLPGDLDRDGFVGIEELNIVLGNWNQNVAVGNLMQGDASGDGFVGIEDLNAVLGNWNATLEPPTVEGDLDNDGFVGITDLNIVLGSWNQEVTPGNLTQGDASDDGFVGIEDLNIVLGNWNAGTPPAVEAIATSTREAVETASTSPAIESRTHTMNRRSSRTWPSDEAASKRQYSTHSPAVAAAWSYLNQRSQRVDNAGYMPWSLRQQEEPAVLGLWEQHNWNAEPASPSR
jgi:hypothetical protein